VTWKYALYCFTRNYLKAIEKNVSFTPSRQQNLWVDTSDAVTHIYMIITTGERNIFPSHVRFMGEAPIINNRLTREKHGNQFSICFM
jgi:hypothetical protein